MMTANFLQLSRVRDACAEFLMARLCPSNVLGVKTFADTLGKLKCKKNYQKCLFQKELEFTVPFSLHKILDQNITCMFYFQF